MEKKFTISLALLFIAVVSFAQCPDYFKRNNGNGTCGSESEIRMYFASCPVGIPLIDSIYAYGSKANVTIGPPSDKSCSSKGYISYCISGDLPPASTLQVYFNFNKDSACDVPSGDPSPGPTPVVLSSFNAVRGGKNAVIVTWKTEQELNSASYEIQRSFNNINFETVGIVASKNSNTSIAQYYSFTDNSNTTNQSSFYRLKMIDLDNSFTYSSIKAVKGSGFESEVSVFPNPSKVDQLITIDNISEPSKISIFDYTGRMIQQISSTGNSVQINNLKTGNYIMKITGRQSGNTGVKKLSVIN